MLTERELILQKSPEKKSQETVVNEESPQHIKYKKNIFEYETLLKIKNQEVEKLLKQNHELRAKFDDILDFQSSNITLKNNPDILEKDLSHKKIQGDFPISENSIFEAVDWRKKWLYNEKSISSEIENLKIDLQKDIPFETESIHHQKLLKTIKMKLKNVSQFEIFFIQNIQVTSSESIL